MSPPVRGRGLKPASKWEKAKEYAVAPRAGAWIETGMQELTEVIEKVAPRAGAWIETSTEGGSYVIDTVAPRAGAWIETVSITTRCYASLSRPPCGGVD